MRGPESASQLASATARRMTADSRARSEIRDSSTTRGYRRPRSTLPQARPLSKKSRRLRITASIRAVVTSVTLVMVMSSQPGGCRFRARQDGLPRLWVPGLLMIT